MGKKPFSFLSPRRTEEREGRSALASIPALWGMVAAGDEGKRERRLRGFDSPLTSAGVECGGRATRAGGGGARQIWRRR